MDNINIDLLSINKDPFAEKSFWVCILFSAIESLLIDKKKILRLVKKVSHSNKNLFISFHCTENPIRISQLTEDDK